MTQLKQLPRSSGDTGAADQVLAAALAADDRTTALSLLPRARLFVPIGAAILTGGLDPGTGPTMNGVDSVDGADKQSDTLLALLEDASGRRWLPAFSGIPAFTRWSRTHRPVRGSGADLAGEALGRGLAGLVVDPAGPAPLVVEGVALVAVAEGRAPGTTIERVPLRLRPAAGAVPDLGEVVTEAHRIEVSTDGGRRWATALGVVPAPGTSVAVLATAALAAGWTQDLVPLAGGLLRQARGEGLPGGS